MKAIVTATFNGRRFFLTRDNLGTDVPQRALEFRDRTDAAIRAAKENVDPAWLGLRGKWRAGYMLSNGQIAIQEEDTCVL